MSLKTSCFYVRKNLYTQLYRNKALLKLIDLLLKHDYNPEVYTIEKWEVIKRMRRKKRVRNKNTPS
ncbi:hypothetical protein COD76_22075 [Bacillus cereus]|nr:hypothetical protein COD76_22075 [Bacillus cereus]